MRSSGKTILLALGGNAITKAYEKGTAAEQWANIIESCRHIAALVAQDHRVVITHGNGPQVGNLLLKNDLCKDVVPPMPLNVCVSNTQGSIGYAFQQCLGNELRRRGISRPIVTVITQVVVDPKDPAFQNPTKFIGPFYTREEAQQLARERGYQIKEDSNRGWRRVVPSPDPREIIEGAVICGLVDAGVIVIAAGGGGIPVVRDADGNLRGVEAVIDKDLAGEKLARAVEADAYFMLTAVERVAIRFGTPAQQDLPRMTVAEARRYLVEGHFPPGSMGPKIQAAVRFVEGRPGKSAVIVSLEQAARALAGEAGTLIVAE